MKFVLGPASLSKKCLCAPRGGGGGQKLATDSRSSSVGCGEDTAVAFKKQPYLGL